MTGPLAAAMSGGMVLAVVRLHARLMSDALAGMLLGAGLVIGLVGILSIATARSDPDMVAFDAEDIVE